MRTALLARVVTPIVALAAAGGLLAAGSHAPTWIGRLGGIAGIGDIGGLRFAAGSLAGLGAASLLIGRASRGLALATSAVLAFGGVASVSGSLSIAGATPTLLAGIASIVVGGILFLLLGSAQPASTSPGGPSPAWGVLAFLAISTASLAMAAKAPMRTPPVVRRDLPVASNGERYIDLAFDSWEGSRLSDTPLAEHLPKLVAAIGNGTAWIVFYNPRCGHCHELFRAHFAQPSDIPIYAIEVPPPPDAEVLESDQPEAIDCPSCQHERLPLGRGWLVTPPTVVRVEHGIVRCVAEPNLGVSCFDER